MYDETTPLTPAMRHVLEGCLDTVVFHDDPCTFTEGARGYLADLLNLSDGQPIGTLIDVIQNWDLDDEIEAAEESVQ